MTKVAHLTASISRNGGGLFEAVLRLAQAHGRSRFDNRVFGLRDAATDADLPKWAPVPAAAFAAKGFKPLGWSPEFAPALENFAPDICHTHGLWVAAGVAARNYGREYSKPCVISPHGMLDPWALKNSRWKKKLAWALFERANLREARCLRALCEPEARSIRRLGLKNEIAVVPNGIDLPAGDPPAAPPWKDKIESGKKILLYLGRIHPKKGLVNLLKAWAEIRRPDWALAIAGWDQGGHEAELKQLCSERQMAFADLRAGENLAAPPAAVVFLGPQFDAAKAACYHHCDAFVLPSFSEGLPMVVLEAWAHAKPVLMTPECNLPEGFQAAAALRIEAEEKSVAAGLDEFFQLDETGRVAMGRRGRELAEGRFTWPRVAGQMEEVYAWMLGGAKPNCLAPF